MHAKDDDLYLLLKKGPSILFLGQDYLRLESGNDPFLSEIIRKYHPNTSIKATQYSLIFESDAKNSVESSLSWMHERCNRVAPPQWLSVVSEYSWNSVYVSAIDVIWQGVFRNEWRELHHIFDDKYFPNDLRNPSRLHCTYLYGNVSRSEELERPPLDQISLAYKESVAASLANRLPEIVTPFGVLIIEGYAGERDWFDPRKLVPVVNKLNQNQVHIFSVKNDLPQNPFIKHFVDLGKIILHKENLATFLLRGKQSGSILLGKLPEFAEHDRRIQIGTEILNVPSDVWNQVSLSANILDDSIFIPPQPLSQDRLYIEFRNFLSESSILPIWEGYKRGFAFHREFENNLYKEVCKKLKLKELQDEPIILCGQTGTGKTIALGSLAYNVKCGKKYPVLFIERKNEKPNNADIDEFCKWAEDSGAPATLIIWDGMVDVENYYNLMRYLVSRGRKVVLVGSSYRMDANKRENFIEAPARFTQKEISDFFEYINGFNLEIGKLIESSVKEFDNTFLVALYRLLPPTRGLIRTGVQKEFNLAQNLMHKKIGQKTFKVPSTTLGFALLKAGLISGDFSEYPEKVVCREQINEVEELVGLVIVPGTFGFNVPMELLLRAWSRGTTSNLVDIIEETDIFRIHEDDSGNISIGPRHPLEAKLLVQSIFGMTKAEVEFVNRLLLEINQNYDVEIQFAVDLIKSIGPNSRLSGQDLSRFTPYYLELSETLRTLREERGIKNPRLMLQEATLLREYVSKNSQRGKIPKDAIEIFDKAENILEKAITSIKNNRKKDEFMESVLLVELSSTLASKAQHILDQTSSPENSIRLFKRAQDHLLKARGLNPTNYPPLDVHIWIAENMLKSDLLDPQTRAETEADILSVIETAEPENFSTEQQTDFDKRRLQIANLLGKEELSEEAFKSLISKGSCAGYYLRAYEKIKDVPFYDKLSSTHHWSCKLAVNYLNENRQVISHDSQCLHLLLHTWWKMKTSKPIFYGEKQTVNFSQEDWHYLLGILSDLMSIGNFSSKPSLIYLRGLATFHLKQFEESFRAFKELEQVPNYVAGKRRIIRSYLASTPQGSPDVFDGTVVWVSNDGKSGELYVDKIRRKVRFVPREFNRPNIQERETINKFYIAFNFIGPIALPMNLFKSEKR